ncbi:UDP-glucose dehydrogenase family protein [Cohaesibacter gelatinilyticus]|uniref:UDP-glucose 6-dehydrogenase n=1 Tax=Cohaesibacter gelatinilyticus TaxID=372072 RepID=A0A285PH97_9HYPH|nr:UDP-glucose/GDP-mannose dehydrogenase family protein [Cohaesibacter gelatinilyticus]SNZ20653.1 UDP-glucose dehydrogenase [Cohaesibacter gelatinilyticus]
MKVVMIGTGYVGLVSGVCFSEFGFDVTCVDVDQSKIDTLNKGEVPIFEPGLDTLLDRNTKAGRLTFTTNFDEAVSQADAIFIAVGTPSRRGDGEADLQYVWAAARQIANAAKPGVVIVTKSTVVVGTNRKVAEIIREENPDLDFSIASNPEFLREGSALEDFMRPDRVVVGVEDKRAEEVMRNLYRPLFLRETPIVFTGLEDAELIKYAANAFLAVKISFINEVANLCEQVGGNVQQVASAIGLDKRIGGKFLHAGPGFGGSCFPKDTRAFAATGEKFGAPQRLVEAVIEVNESRKANMAERVLAKLGPDPKGKTVCILGVAFKPNTDDVRESPTLAIIPILQEAGVIVRAHDPEGMDQAKPQLDNVIWCSDAYDAAEGADALALVTEWNEYRALDMNRLHDAMNGDVVVDMRNVYQPDNMRAKGFDYSSIGRA